MKRACLWSYRPIDMTCFPFYAENETQRVWFRCNADTGSVRVRLSNEYNYFRLPVAGVSVAVCDEEGNLTGPSSDVLFGGKKSFSIMQDAMVASDDTPVAVKAGEYLAVSVYFAERVKITSGCNNGQGTFLENVSCGKGNLCKDTSIDQYRYLGEKPEFVRANGNRYNLLCAAFWGVDAIVDDDVREIYAFGDSITNHGFWSENLALRLYCEYPGKAVLSNLGISGNKILNETTSMKKFANFFGERGLSRFGKDVYGWGCKPDTVVFQIGINDIIHNVHGVSGPDVSAKEIFDGLCKLASTAHENGSKVVVCTLTPFGGYFGDKTVEQLQYHEDKRQAVNRMIKSSQLFDHVVDYASFMEDPNCTVMCKKGYCRDGLHPTPETGASLANLFDLSIF